ncbi:hypothetical protein EYR41_002082 [Orbilia oligospora]|uniref:Uncharacterized protein n=1 Tax=Orbilia oligospora TaxID=2813651 RepID=A0A8H2I0H3_ORBOL|nr:hypothetical protein EYR41_002082 [Orbilia oligospora]
MYFGLLNDLWCKVFEDLDVEYEEEEGYYEEVEVEIDEEDEEIGLLGEDIFEMDEKKILEKFGVFG